jgi:uncharacterized integral membrane protein
MSEYWKALSLWNKVKFTISIIIGILGVVFATLNWNDEEVHLLFFQTTMPLTLVIIISIIVGYAVAYVLNFQTSRKKEKEIQNLQEQNQKLAHKLKNFEEVD